MCLDVLHERKRHPDGCAAAVGPEGSCEEASLHEGLPSPLKRVVEFVCGGNPQGLPLRIDEGDTHSSSPGRLRRPALRRARSRRRRQAGERHRRPSRRSSSSRPPKPKEAGRSVKIHRVEELLRGWARRRSSDRSRPRSRSRTPHRHPPMRGQPLPPCSAGKILLGQVPAQAHSLKQLEHETYRGKVVVRRGVTEPRSRIHPVRTTPLPLGPVTGMSTVKREPYFVFKRDPPHRARHRLTKMSADDLAEPSFDKVVIA
jgi:hypothetical protein